tara:strand:- start:1843 stop:2394 length:552 start_codon:yes stop_codon:yes gene_type:complete
MFNTCGLFKTSHFKYPDIHDQYTNEFLDMDLQIWLPMFLWWDKQHALNREVPCDYIHQNSLKRYEYVKRELRDIEYKKLNYYQQLINNRNIDLEHANYVLDEWYFLKEQILRDEHKNHENLELDQYCQICFERTNDCITVPCNHEFCQVCYVKFPKKECPFCKTVIQSVIHTPISLDSDSKEL